MKQAMKVPKRSYVRVFVSDLSGGMNSFTDGRVLPFAQGETAFNVTVDSGALKSGCGAAETDIPSRLHKVFCYTVYDDEQSESRAFLLAHDEENGKMYGRSEDGETWQEIDGVTFAAAPMGVNYRLYGEDVFLLCGAEGMAVVRDDLSAVTVTSAPDITGIAMHNERMFVTIGGRQNAVWFSDDLDPTNWNPELDEGGFIEMEGDRGRLNTVVAFGGYVYVFRDYGISRLTAFGAQTEFSVTNLFVSSGKIYPDTVAVCGDRILFLAADGLYSFDGLTTARIARHLDGLIRPSERAVACYCAGKYYLSTASEAGGENDLLTVIDPRTKTTSVNKDVRVRSFSPIVQSAGETLYVCSPDAEHLGVVRTGGDYFGNALQRSWRTGMSDLNAPDKRKLVTDVYLDTKYPCTATVSTERGSKTFSFAGSNAVQRKRVNLIGTKVRLEIVAEGEIDLARPTLRYTALS